MKPLPARTVSSLLASGLLLSGVALAEESGYLHIQTPGASVTARVTDKDITGPDFQLSHSADAMRGRAYGRVVSLRIEDDLIGGLIGNLPVRVKLEKTEAGTLKGQGTFAGRYTTLEINRDELKGRVGNCAYELKAKEHRYEGWRSCGGPLEFPVYVEIPPSLARSGAPTTLAAISLLLAQR